MSEEYSVYADKLRPSGRSLIFGARIKNGLFIKQGVVIEVSEFLWNANSLKALNYNTVSSKSMKYKFVYRSMFKVNLM